DVLLAQRLLDLGALGGLQLRAGALRELDALGDRALVERDRLELARAFRRLAVLLHRLGLLDGLGIGAQRRRRRRDFFVATAGAEHDREQDEVFHDLHRPTAETASLR